MTGRRPLVPAQRQTLSFLVCFKFFCFYWLTLYLAALCIPEHDGLAVLPLPGEGGLRVPPGWPLSTMVSTGNTGNTGNIR